MRLGKETQMKMTFDEAKALLKQSNREELVDHTFNDAEVYWSVDGKEIADGYFGRYAAGVGFKASDKYEATEFSGYDAWELRHLGTFIKAVRNDNQP